MVRNNKMTKIDKIYKKYILDKRIPLPSEHPIIGQRWTISLYLDASHNILRENGNERADNYIFLTSLTKEDHRDMKISEILK